MTPGDFEYLKKVADELKIKEYNVLLEPPESEIEAKLCYLLHNPDDTEISTENF